MTRRHHAAALVTASLLVGAAPAAHATPLAKWLAKPAIKLIEFISGRSADLPVSRAEQWYRWTAIRSSMALMPAWAQELTHTAQPRAVQRWGFEPSDRLRARILRCIGCAETTS